MPAAPLSRAMPAYPTLRPPRLLTAIAPELLRHLMLATLAALLAVPVRHLDQTIRHLSHWAAGPLVDAPRTWPMRIASAAETDR